ncbi:hypothetical protein PAHAL_4G317700 [Panicum hallii]|uniref:Uncharacterized protein n=1 Tax=Panicum hallii TaxID=206008 RepID=A0A2T8JEP9_9POAL|nr:uncharacterized protein LOC112889484 isoform X1 [Panicum hallii]XP_025813869.1 uncharacterized protein LOC112891150 isoform X1 [Panicum hallii]PAN25666.1 hypothetical protein PAHAL_4G317300 [Panicum hallii]PVH48378.1 hypothetical protein PAHAL_4G317700 [Panicum hallii]
MELLPDRAHVRLRSPAHGTYLYADEDGVGVSLRSRRASLSTVWAVHRVERSGNSFVLLHSAAYGRYLASSPEYINYAPDGVDGVVQCCYFNDLDQQDILWEAVGYRGDALFLHNPENRRWSRLWAVEAVPARVGPPLLPPPTPNPMLLRRMILYMKADEYGNIDYESTKLLVFEGHSVSRLRDELAFLLEEWHAVRITMCVWAGSHGRLTPLVVDLPLNNQTVEIVVYESWSRAAQGLQYPNVDAP